VSKIDRRIIRVSNCIEINCKCIHVRGAGQNDLIVVCLSLEYILVEHFCGKLAKKKENHIIWFLRVSSVSPVLKKIVEKFGHKLTQGIKIPLTRELK
jgi:hypothetical protein